MGGCAHVDGASDVFERRAKFDLSYEYEWFHWDDSVNRPILSRPNHRIRPHHSRVSWLNPNKLFLAEVRFANTSINWIYFPDDSDYWIRDEND